MKNIYICLLYGLSATLMNISSKWLISSYHVNPSFSILIIQYSVLVYFGHWKKYTVDWNEFKECALISMLSVGNIVFGGIGMKYVNLPMYIALRKLCTAEVFLIDVFVFKQDFKCSCILGVLGISLGAIIAGFNDLTSEIHGYLIVLLANLMNALLLLQIRAAKEKVPSLISFKQTYICSVISLPFSIIMLYTLNEPLTLAISPYYGSWSFFIAIFLTSLLGVACNYLIFKCAADVSPMATSVTGNAKDFVSMIFGLVAFSDSKPNLLFLAGLFISMTGAVVYSLGKLMKNKKVGV